MSPQLLTASITNQTAPIAMREVAAQAARRLWEAEDLRVNFMEQNGIQELIHLSTCNRTEIYALTTQPRQAVSSIARALHPAGPDRKSALTFYRNTDVAEHIFRVASGMDSLIVGETEILGQVRRAYEDAQARQTLGPVLHQLFRDAIRVARRTHTETAISTGAASIAHAAVTLATRYMSGLGLNAANNNAASRVLVLGAGEMGRRIALNLQQNTARTGVGSDLLIASRTWEHALNLAQDLRGHAIPWEQIPQALAEVDIAFSALRTPQAVITRSMLADAREPQALRPLCLVDIALPRNIEAEVALLPGVRLFNLDDLKEIAAHNRQERQVALDDADEIVRQEAASFGGWLRARRAVPAIVQLRQQAEAIRQAELHDALNRLGHLDPRDQEIIRAMSAGLVNKLLHAPTITLKAQLAGRNAESEHPSSQISETENPESYLHMFRELFALPEEANYVQGSHPL